MDDTILNVQKSISLARIGKRRSNSLSDNVSCKSDENHNFDELCFETAVLNHDRILEEVDQFIRKLDSAEDKLKVPQIPDFIQSFLRMVESRIARYEASTPKFIGQNKQEDVLFFESITLVLRFMQNLNKFPHDSVTTKTWFNQASSVHNRALLLMDQEFRAVLKDDINSKRSYNHQDTEENENSFPSFSSEAIPDMNRLASAMIFAGYEPECRMAYIDMRLKALNLELDKQGFENIKTDDVQKMSWESLGGEIANWIQIVKNCSTNVFPAERKLCLSVFSEQPLIAQALFIDLATSVTVRFLNFANGVVLTKRSMEKLFKFLDMYETLRDLITSIGDNDSSAENLINETWVTQCRFGEAAVNIFCQLENSIKSDNGRIPVARGAVHPLTRYTMNYLKYSCEYKDTVELVFQRHLEMEESTKRKVANEKLASADDGRRGRLKTSPFSVELMTVMNLLDANIDMKSMLYRDPSLSYIFLMNNGRYTLKKIKGSKEIFEMIGRSYTRKRSTELRQYHKNYQRETWSKVLQSINPDGLQVNGKVSKKVLTERLKTFNAMFDEIYKTQSTWVVCDEQLQSELRVSITAVVIPAYRSFVGRFKSNFDKIKQAEKYIKHQPEDIEGLIDHLFEGKAVSGRKKM